MEFFFPNWSCGLCRLPLRHDNRESACERIKKLKGGLMKRFSCCSGAMPDARSALKSWSSLSTFPLNRLERISK